MRGNLNDLPTSKEADESKQPFSMVSIFITDCSFTKVTLDFLSIKVKNDTILNSNVWAKRIGNTQNRLFWALGSWRALRPELEKWPVFRHFGKTGNDFRMLTFQNYLLEVRGQAPCFNWATFSVKNAGIALPPVKGRYLIFFAWKLRLCKKDFWLPRTRDHWGKP